MIDVRQGGPGEVEVEMEFESGALTWGTSAMNDRLVVWFDPSRALDLANKLMDIVQAMDETEREREEDNDAIVAQQELEDFEDADDRLPGASEIL